jgi:hypothetical protein
MNDIFKTAAGENVHYVDPAPMLFDRDGQTINYDQGRAIYRDDNHLTKWGVDRITPLLTSMLTDIEMLDAASKK